MTPELAERLMRVSESEARKLYREAPGHWAPYDSDDVQAEILARACDPLNAVTNDMSDAVLAKRLRQLANDWRQDLIDARLAGQVTDRGLSLEADPGFLAERAERKHFDSVRSITSVADDYHPEFAEETTDAFAAEEARFEAEMAPIIKTLGLAAEGKKYPRAPESEARVWLAEVFGSMPGKDRDMDARRRILALALWSMYQRTLEPGTGWTGPGKTDQRDRDRRSLRLLFARYGRRNAKLNEADRQYLSRTAVPDLVREINRILGLGKDPVFGTSGPGSRRVMSNASAMAHTALSGGFE